MAGQRRGPGSGRIGHEVNVFSGLVKDAQTGETYMAVTYTWDGGRHR
jgi:hypothetical protein